MKIKKYNRIKKTQPKPSTHYCACDFARVRIGQRCPVCKAKERTKHQKP